MNKATSTSNNCFRIKLADSSRIIEYKSLFIRNFNSPKNHCVLILTGTSTRISDIKYFINLLIKRKNSVASIERLIGGPFHFWINPKVERKEALNHFIHILTEIHHIEKIDIVAHSYASYEVIRVLMENPEKLRKHIGNIIFLNPAGFDDKINFFSHCLRFIFLFIPQEYTKIMLNLFKKKPDNSLSKKFYFLKIRTINCLFIQTIQNPIRTFKEVADITSLTIRPQVKKLMRQYGYTFNFILNTNDKLLRILKTLKNLEEILPKNKIIKFPGNHMDCLIDKRQITFISDNLLNN